MDKQTVLRFICAKGAASVPDVMHEFGTAYGETRDCFAALEAEKYIERSGALAYRLTGNDNPIIDARTRRDASAPRLAPDNPYADAEPDAEPDADMRRRRAELLERLAELSGKNENADGDDEPKQTPEPPIRRPWRCGTPELFRATRARSLPIDEQSAPEATDITQARAARAETLDEFLSRFADDDGDDGGTGGDDETDDGDD